MLNPAANSEIIKYNIEKLGGLESTVSKMEESLRNYELKNIEKNIEKTTHPATHPKYFDPTASASSQYTKPPLPGQNHQNQNPPASLPRAYPYGSSLPPHSDPKSIGLFSQSDLSRNPEIMTNYPYVPLHRAIQPPGGFTDSRQITKWDGK